MNKILFIGFCNSTLQNKEVIIILKTFQEMGDDETICDYCHPTDYGEYKFVHTPNGYDTCEGTWCQEAYDSYLDENDATEKMVKYQNSVKLINKEDYLDE